MTELVRVKVDPVSEPEERESSGGRQYWTFRANVRSGSKVEEARVVVFERAVLDAALEGGQVKARRDQDGDRVSYVIVSADSRDRGDRAGSGKRQGRRDDSAREGRRVSDGAPFNPDRDVQIARMNALGHAVNLAAAGLIGPHHIFPFADDAVHWILTGKRAKDERKSTRPQEVPHAEGAEGQKKEAQQKGEGSNSEANSEDAPF